MTMGINKSHRPWPHRPYRQWEPSRRGWIVCGALYAALVLLVVTMGYLFA
jgi:hypothetical protein